MQLKVMLYGAKVFLDLCRLQSLVASTTSLVPKTTPVTDTILNIRNPLLTRGETRKLLYETSMLHLPTANVTLQKIN